jgi:hypothetical protein
VDLHAGRHECPETDSRIIEAGDGAGCDTLRLFASLYGDHSDYAPETWTPNVGAVVIPIRVASGPRPYDPRD